jgi:hypothetical protein
MQKFLDSEKTTKLEEKNAEGFQSKTESLDSRKQNFPKMPKTTVPPPSEPHCMTAGVNKSGNPYEKNIDEIEEPPVQELENKDIKEELLYANEETNLNLRNILTESLEKNIEKELERYHKKKKNDKSSNFTDPLDEKANTLRDEAMITQNVLNAFVFSKNMEDLAKRHREWQSAIEKIEEVVLQIKDLENMKTDISEDRKNYQKMI